MTSQQFYVSSPVLRVDGEDRAELARDLVYLQCEENRSGLKNLQLRLVAIGPQQGADEQSLLYMDGQIIDFGKRIEVALGPNDNQRIVFDGYISAMELQYEEGEIPEVCLYAEDRLMDLRMTRRSATYEDMSDADIASNIAEQHNLRAEVDLEGPTYDRIQQLNMSDLAFLRERARLLQADIWLSDDTLFFKSRERRDRLDLTLVRGNDILSINACADLAHQRTGVKVSGYDANNRELIDEVAGSEVVQSEISGGQSGPEILQGAFGERVSQRVREVPLDASEAQAWAKAEMLRRARQFISVHGLTRGHPNLCVGAWLRLERLGLYSGDDYYVTQVRHTYDLSNMHRTHFHAEKAAIGQANS